MSPVDLGEVVAGAIETVRPTLDEAQHELTVKLPNEPIRLPADSLDRRGCRD